MPPYWPMAGCTSYCSASMTTWPPSNAPADARDAMGCCTRRATRASRVACGGRLSPEYGWRLSFCCARRDCRKRATPPSLRFLGRKVYLGAVVVLIAALRCGPTPARMRHLEELVGVNRRTVGRWRRWWCEELIDTPFWRAASGTVMPPAAARGDAGLAAGAICGQRPGTIAGAAALHRADHHRERHGAGYLRRGSGPQKMRMAQA